MKKKKENNTDESEDIYILKLDYCKKIIRAFIEVQAIFPKFNKLIPEIFEIYKKMIISSLESVKDFHGKDDIVLNHCDFYSKIVKKNFLKWRNLLKKFLEN